MKTRYLSILLVAVALLLAVIVWVARNTTVPAQWERARRLNTMVSYERFLKANPETEFSLLAKDELARLRKAVQQMHAESFNAMCEGKYDQAVTSLQKLVQCAPEDPLALNNLGVLYALRGDFSQANSLLSRATNIVCPTRLKNLVLFIAYTARAKQDDPLGILAAYLPSGAEPPAKNASVPKEGAYFGIKQGEGVLTYLSDYYPEAASANDQQEGLRPLILMNALALARRSSVVTAMPCLVRAEAASDDAAGAPKTNYSVVPELLIPAPK